MSSIKPLPADCIKARAIYVIDGKRCQMTDAPDALRDRLMITLGIYKNMRLISVVPLA